MSAKRVVAGDDPVLRFRGAVSLHHGPGWVAPWRVPCEEVRLHLPEGGIGRAATARLGPHHAADRGRGRAGHDRHHGAARPRRG
ncbi:hypothetical protein [Streptomyces sp. NPDC048473]|uniref:hypothetical protein n=1 Tax=unclassified Streptomyces TaxID=2593676 RepID=UPI00371E5B38